MRHAIKYKNFIIGFIIFCTIVSCIIFRNFLSLYLNDSCNLIYQNYIVEIVSGLIFSLFPIIFGIYFGKKLKEYEFYTNVEKFIRTLRLLRERDLIKPEVVRHIMKKVAKNFGREGIQDKYIDKIIKKYENNNESQEKCKICDLIADVTNRKCKYCNMDYYTWNLDEEQEEEKEISEILSKLSNRK